MVLFYFSQCGADVGGTVSTHKSDEAVRKDC